MTATTAMTPTTPTTTATKPWFTSYLAHVDDARDALSRARHIADIKRDAALAATSADSTARLRAARAGGGRPSGAIDPMRKIDNALDLYAEIEHGETYRWARELMRECSHLLDAARRSGDGSVCLGADCVELVHINGMLVNVAAEECLVSRRTLYRAVKSLTSWVDAHDRDELLAEV